MDRETPVESLEGLVEPKRAFTPIEALLNTAPHHEPETSQLELLALRDVLADAIDELAPIEQWVFNAIVVERKSVRTVAREIGRSKSHVHRLYHRTLQKLQAQLKDHPAIKLHLRG